MANKQFFKSGKITENKAFEFVLGWDKEPFSVFTFDISFRTKGDHAGLNIYKRLWKFVFEFNIYDVRHWNREADRFYLPGEEEAERKAQEECIGECCDEE